MNKNNLLLYLMIAGIVLGAFCGWFFGRDMHVVDWIGEIFLDLLKMLVIPLIISSMIVGISGLGDIRKVGKTGLITLIYFTATTAVAVAIGLVVVNLFQPGAGVDFSGQQVPERVVDGEPLGITDAACSLR
jgi:Na+/H+-dicarboxylate symporter